MALIKGELFEYKIDSNKSKNFVEIIKTKDAFKIGGYDYIDGITIEKSVAKAIAQAILDEVENVT